MQLARSASVSSFHSVSISNGSDNFTILAGAGALGNTSGQAGDRKSRRVLRKSLCALLFLPLPPSPHSPPAVRTVCALALHEPTPPFLLTKTLVHVNSLPREPLTGTSLYSWSPPQGTPRWSFSRLPPLAPRLARFPSGQQTRHLVQRCQGLSFPPLGNRHPPHLLYLSLFLFARRQRIRRHISYARTRVSLRRPSFVPPSPCPFLSPSSTVIAPCRSQRRCHSPHDHRYCLIHRRLSRHGIPFERQPRRRQRQRRCRPQPRHLLLPLSFTVRLLDDSGSSNSEARRYELAQAACPITTTAPPSSSPSRDIDTPPPWPRLDGSIPGSWPEPRSKVGSYFAHQGQVPAHTPRKTSPSLPRRSCVPGRWVRRNPQQVREFTFCCFPAPRAMSL